MATTTLRLTSLHPTPLRPSALRPTALRPTNAFPQNLPLFANLSPGDCATITSCARERWFGRRQAIFYEGDPAQHVVALLSGSVKITQLGLGGDEVILRLGGPGEVVSSFHLDLHRAHVSTAQALQPSTVLLWSTSTFENLLERFPAFRRNTVRDLEQRLQELEQRFREVSTERVCSRLSSALLRISNQLGWGPDGPSEICLSRAELAQLTGTSLFTVSRLLCQWQELGIVRIGRGAVQVRDLDALTQLSQSE